MELEELVLDIAPEIRLEDVLIEQNRTTALVKATPIMTATIK